MDTELSSELSVPVYQYVTCSNVEHRLPGLFVASVDRFWRSLSTPVTCPALSAHTEYVIKPDSGRERLYFDKLKDSITRDASACRVDTERVWTQEMGDKESIRMERLIS